MKNVVISETDIPTLNLAVITDFGGPHESPNADHLKFIKKAEDGAPKYEQALREIAQAVVRHEIVLPEPNKPDDVAGFSLDSLMSEEAGRQAAALAKDIFPEEQKLPETISDLHTHLDNNIRYLATSAGMYRLFGYDDFASNFQPRIDEFRRVHESLKSGDGREAYNYYIRRRDEELAGARARDEKKKYFVAIPHQYRASEELTADLMERRKKEQLKDAQWYEQAARIVAQKFPNSGITHTDMVIEEE